LRIPERLRVTHRVSKLVREDDWRSSTKSTASYESVRHKLRF